MRTTSAGVMSHPMCSLRRNALRSASVPVSEQDMTRRRIEIFQLDENLVGGSVHLCSYVSLPLAGGSHCEFARHPTAIGGRYRLACLCRGSNNPKRFGQRNCQHHQLPNNQWRYHSSVRNYHRSSTPDANRQGRERLRDRDVQTASDGIDDGNWGSPLGSLPEQLFMLCNQVRAQFPCWDTGLPCHFRNQGGIDLSFAGFPSQDRQSRDPEFFRQTCLRQARRLGFAIDFERVGALHAPFCNRCCD